MATLIGFGHTVNTNLGYEFDDGSRLRLNGLYEPSGVNGEETRDKSTDALRPIFWTLTVMLTAGKSAAIMSEN
jgi:hypothetical protein